MPLLCSHKHDDGSPAILSGLQNWISSCESFIEVVGEVGCKTRNLAVFLSKVKTVGSCGSAGPACSLLD